MKYWKKNANLKHKGAVPVKDWIYDKEIAIGSFIFSRHHSISEYI